MIYLKKQTLSYIISFIIISPLIFIYALLLYFKQISTTEQAINRSSLIVGIISFFIIGFITSLKHKQRGLINGLISGGLILSIIIILRSVNNEWNGFKDILKYIAYLFSSMLGCIIGVNIFNRKRINKKK